MRRKPFYASLILGIFLIVGLNIIPRIFAATQPEILRMIVGESKMVPVNSPARVVIGNPQVADVTEVTKSEITVAGKSAGMTTLVFWDAFGEQAMKIKVFSEDIGEIKNRVDNLLRSLNIPTVSSALAEDEGKVLILGSVKTEQDKERVHTALATLKDKIVDLLTIKEEESMVEIDVQVLELAKDATNTLGFTWPGSISLTERGSPGVATTTPTQVGTSSTINAATPIGTKWSTLFKVFNLSREAFNFSLDLLIQQGKARILSRPRLSCQSNKEAELLVGGEKPVFTTQVASAGGQGTQVEYKEFGIKLQMKPIVTEDDRIKLALKVEVSDVGEAEVIGPVNAPTAKAYPLSKRSASTELFLDDGQTMAIGGLIKQKSEEDLRKFPWLGDIPVLGMFFRKTTTKSGGGQGLRGDTELFITLTPRIISDHPIKTKKKDADVIPVAGVPVTPLGNYTAVVQRRITEQLGYPDAAKEAGFQGKVTLRLHIAYNGELLAAAVKGTSGYQILDDNALAAAKSISSYPPFPSSLEARDLWVEVPVAYRLD